MDSFLDKKGAEGEFKSDGVFTLNPKLSYLRSEGAVLPEPQQWVLKVFQAVSLLQPERVCCYHGEDGLTLSLYGGAPLQEATLHSNLSDGGLPKDEAHKALTLALWEWLRQEGEAVLECFCPKSSWALSVSRGEMGKAKPSKQASTGPSQRWSFHRQTKNLFTYQLESRLLFTALQPTGYCLEINDDPHYPFEPAPPVPKLGMTSRRILVSISGYRAHISDHHQSEIVWPIALQHTSKLRFQFWFPNATMPGDSDRFTCLLGVTWCSQPEPSELCWIKNGVVVEREKLALPSSALKIQGFAPIPADTHTDLTGLKFSDSSARKYLRQQWVEVVKQELASLPTRDLKFPGNAVERSHKNRIASALIGGLCGSLLSPGFGTFVGVLIGLGTSVMAEGRNFRREIADLFEMQDQANQANSQWAVLETEQVFQESQTFA